MFHRRELLKGLSLGAGSMLLGPVVKRLHAEAKGDPKLPQRFVFVVRANGLRTWGLAAEGLQKYGEQRHKQQRFVSESLAERRLHATMRELEPLKD